jgi:outer membrane lipoprotein
MKTLTMLTSAGLACGLILSGCASTVPESIRIAPADDIRVEEAQQAGAQFVDSQVRWGGTIISVKNQANETLIELLSRKLSKDGKPLTDSKSQGRFIARIKGFLEPEEYPKDRLMTVTGTLRKVVEKPVGDYPYPYPVVDVKSYHLWPQEKNYPPPYYYDPFYDPYFYPYPYWRRHPYYW